MPDQCVHLTVLPPLQLAAITSGHRQRSLIHQDALHHSTNAPLVPVVVRLAIGLLVGLVAPMLHQQSMQLHVPLLQWLPSRHHQWRIRPSALLALDLLIVRFHLLDQHDGAAQHALEAEHHYNVLIVDGHQQKVLALLQRPTAKHECHANHQVPL